MNLKKIFAALSATAVAATMAISASAAITSDIPDSADDGSGNYQIALVGDAAVKGEFADVDVTKIASFDITFSWEEGDDVWAGGAIVLQSDSLGWKPAGSVSNGQWSSADDGKDWSNAVSGEAIHVDITENPFSADDTYAFITVQSYGVDVTIDSLVLYDASGNVLYGADDAAADDTTAATDDTTAATDDTTASTDDTTAATDTTSTSTGSTSTTTTSTTTASNSNTNTGATAGLALAGLALAGAAIVATKKSK